MRARRLLITLAALVAALIATAGSALAYWGTSGSGSGSATTGTMTFTVTAQPASTLVPGGSSSVTATVDNPNGYALPVTSITGGAISASCTSPAVTFTAPSTLPTLAAGSNSYALGTASMGLGASSDCQGKTITISITVTVQK